MNLDFADGLFFGLGFLFSKGVVELLKIAFVIIFCEDKQD
jgi:hypothetical protein